MSVYGQTFTLLEPLERVECWNFSSEVIGNFAAGETITVLHGYDSTQTTIQCAEKDGRPVFNPDGTPLMSKHKFLEGGEPAQQVGYRFIVNNEALGKAIGVDMPKKTPDLVGDLMAYEDGTATPKQTKRLFRQLRKSGIGSKLQGHYSSRM